MECRVKKKKNNYDLSCPITLTSYFGGLIDFSITPGFEFNKKGPTHSSCYSVEVAYYYEPSTFNPTIPEQYFEYNLSYERTYEGSVSKTGTYNFSVVQGLGSGRFDFKNSLYLTLRKTFNSGLLISGRIGGVWRISNIKGAGYVQPVANGRAVMMFNKKNILMAQLFAAYAIYQPSYIPTWVPAQHGQNGKEYEKLSYTLTEPRIPLYSLYLGFEREITKKIMPNFYYMVTLYGTGKSTTPSVSHQMGIVFPW